MRLTRRPNDSFHPVKTRNNLHKPRSSLVRGLHIELNILSTEKLVMGIGVERVEIPKH